MFTNPYHCFLHSQYFTQLKLSTTATLGTVKSGHFIEMIVVEAETSECMDCPRKKQPL